MNRLPEREREDFYGRRIRPILAETGLREALRGAHIPEMAEHYVRKAILAGALGAAAFVSIFLAFQHFGYELVIGDLPAWATTATGFLVLCLFPFLGIYAYPYLAAMGRRTEIDLDLPYTITYMQALSTTMSLYHVIRRVHEESDLFGEVSREFGVIVRNVEVFGDDLYTAIRDLQRTTPSQNLRDFLNDLVVMSTSGGDLTTFLAARSANFREIARNEMEMMLKTLEVMAEVYVTAFVAGPIAIIVMVVAQNLAGQSTLSGWLPLVYLGLFLGSIAMIVILHILLPSDHLTIRRREVRESEYWSGCHREELLGSLDRRFLSRINSIRSRIRLKTVLKNPVRYYISDYIYAQLIGTIGVVVIFLLYLTGALASLSPLHQMEVLVALLVIVALFPIAVAYEGRRMYVNSVEKQLPDFLRELAEMKDIGLTLQGAIDRISRARLGVLSSELQVVSAEVRQGSSIDIALSRMEERIGLVSVKRAISVVVRASEITDYLRDILMIAISDFEHYLKMKRDRFNACFVYVMIIYLSFGIFLYTIYALNVSFIASFANLNVPLTNAGNLTDMFRIAILLGGFSGIMAGQLSSNSVLAGFKHTIAFLIGTLLLFLVIIPYASGGMFA
ncbi:MAG: type II secretion system F family protein [Methanomicrobiales archaeon]|nr:type II secretion system F family protein [Methanomicrobiales archaeon]